MSVYVEPHVIAKCQNCPWQSAPCRHHEAVRMAEEHIEFEDGGGGSPNLLHEVLLTAREMVRWNHY